MADYPDRCEARDCRAGEDGGPKRLAYAGVGRPPKFCSKACKEREARAQRKERRP